MAYTGKRPGNVNTDFLDAGGELANHDEITVDASGNITATSYVGDGSSLTGIDAGTPFLGTVINTSSHLTLTANDTQKLVNVTASGQTVTLPTAATDLVFGVINSSDDTIAIVAPAGTETLGTFTGSLTMGSQEELIISCDGTNWHIIGDNGSVGINIIKFAASGTYTPSSNCASFLAMVTGASGDVANGGTGTGAGGSGGGGYSEKYYSSPAASYSVTVGAAGTSGGNGGTTTFDVMSISGSSGATGATGTAGATGSGGDFNANGGTGGNAGGADSWGYNNGGGGGAAGSRAGNGGNGGNGDYSSGGSGCGGGGGAGASNASGTTAGTAATTESASVYSLTMLTLTTFASPTDGGCGCGCGDGGASSEGTYTDPAGNTVTICGGGGGSGGDKPGYGGGPSAMDGQITIVEFY